MADSLKNDFGLAYATVLTKIFNQWMHDEDSGCDYDAVGQRQVYLFNNIMAIFQPKGSDGWIEEAALIFTLTKEGRAAGHKLNDATFKKFAPIIETVNKKLYESWTNFIRSRNNKWMEEMTKPEFATYQDFVNALCGITKSIVFEKGVIKFSYEIKYWYMDYSINYWNPIELIKWTMDSPSYNAYMATMWAKKENEYRNVYNYSEELIAERREQYMSKDLPTYLVQHPVKLDAKRSAEEEEREEYLQKKGNVCVIPTIRSCCAEEPEESLSGKKRPRVGSLCLPGSQEPATKKSRANST